LWVDPTFFAVNSTNRLQVAWQAAGPWISLGSAPWQPRASAAFVPSPDGTSLIMASGLSFLRGKARAPTYGDVWRVDASVCLVSPVNQLVCAGHGTPDLSTVVCVCALGWTGLTCDEAA
jgi:hypothetical protein